MLVARLPDRGWQGRDEPAQRPRRRRLNSGCGPERVFRANF